MSYVVSGLAPDSFHGTDNFLLLPLYYHQAAKFGLNNFSTIESVVLTGASLSLRVSHD